MKKNLFSTLCMAFAVALTVVSCGDDDPIPSPTPTPEPEPEPETPTVTYNGYSYVLGIDSIAGSEEAAKTFLTMLNDTIAAYGLEMKTLQADGYALVYGVSMTYNKDDEKEKAAYEALKAKCKSLSHSVLRYMSENRTEPVVTAGYVYVNNSASSVSKDWNSFSLSGTSAPVKGVLSIPNLKKTTWKTKDAKGSGVESVYFGSWTTYKTLKATRSTSIVSINGEELKEVTALRQGALVIIMNKENKVIYGFTITNGGKQLALLQKDGQTLEKDAIVYYDLESAEVTE